jgi:hypothetical protein
MGACYNTILLPTLGRDALLEAIAAFLDKHGAEVERVQHQKRRGEHFVFTTTGYVLFGPPSEAGWIPVASWGDRLSEFPVWYTANPLARSLSQARSPAIYVFSFDAGLVAGYSVFADGDQVEGQTAPWKEGVSVGNDFALPAPPPGPNSRLGAALGDPAFDYVRFVRSFRNVEIATGALVARFGVAAHLMDPLHMTKGQGQALVGGRSELVTLRGWSCVSYRRRGGNAEPAAAADRPRDRR